VTTTRDAAAKLAALTKRLEKEMPELAAEPRDPVDELIFSLLLSDTTSARADQALQKLRQSTIDDNDLRVTLTEDLLGIIGERYSKGRERLERIRAALTEIYEREYAVTLESASEKPKREARTYLESLDGMTPFAAARVLLLCFGGHAFPVDEQMRACLVAEGCLDEELDLAAAQSFLERQIKAADAPSVYPRLQAWAEDAASSARRKTRGGTSKKTTKKASG
jgi:endonuclease III